MQPAAKTPGLKAIQDYRVPQVLKAPKEYKALLARRVKRVRKVPRGRKALLARRAVRAKKGTRAMPERLSVLSKLMDR